MPVFLAPEQFDLWLSPATLVEQVIDAIALSREDFVAHPVSTGVGDTVNNFSELLNPVSVAQQQWPCRPS